MKYLLLAIIAFILHGTLSAQKVGYPKVVYNSCTGKYAIAEGYDFFVGDWWIKYDYLRYQSDKDKNDSLDYGRKLKYLDRYGAVQKGEEMTFPTFDEAKKFMDEKEAEQRWVLKHVHDEIVRQDSIFKCQHTYN